MFINLFFCYKNTTTEIINDCLIKQLPLTDLKNKINEIIDFRADTVNLEKNYAVNLEKISKVKANSCLLLINTIQQFNELMNLKIIYNVFVIDNIFHENEVFSNLKMKFQTTFSHSIFHDVILHYTTINHEENNYIELLNNIITTGTKKIDRTNVGTLGLFGQTLIFSIRNNTLPLFTHRKMFLRGIIEELLFFISGKTDTKILENKKVNIWKKHTSRDFLNSRGLHHYKEGCYGSMYGFMLRHFGEHYSPETKNYKGFDQLNYVINNIKNDPTSRRHVISYWNPCNFDEQPLYSCHILYIFNVDVEKHEINCSLTMRSSDCSLAYDFNLCSASILTFLLCKCTNYKPGLVAMHTVDTHIYLNQIDTVKEFIKNEPYPFPMLKINKNLNTIRDLEQVEYKDFELLFYNSYDKYTLPLN